MGEEHNIRYSAQVTFDNNFGCLLTGLLNSEISLSGHIKQLGILTGHVAINTEHEIYSGSYDVTPNIEQQILDTSDKIMTQNVKVEAIPYYTVSNEYGGNTVIIGGNI